MPCRKYTLTLYHVDLERVNIQDITVGLALGQAGLQLRPCKISFLWPALFLPGNIGRPAGPKSCSCGPFIFGVWE